MTARSPFEKLRHAGPIAQEPEESCAVAVFQAQLTFAAELSARQQTLDLWTLHLQATHWTTHPQLLPWRLSQAAAKASEPLEEG